jgi:hypothetical protein
MKVYFTINGNQNNADIRLDSCAKERRHNSALTHFTFENTTDAVHYTVDWLTKRPDPASGV